MLYRRVGVQNRRNYEFFRSLLGQAVRLARLEPSLIALLCAFRMHALRIRRLQGKIDKLSENRLKCCPFLSEEGVDIHVGVR